MTELNELKSRIEYVLRREEGTRNCDIFLMIILWKVFYNVWGDTLLIEKLYTLPTHESIKRIRSKIQNEEHKYLPTTKEIAIKRGWLEEEWRSFLGYKPTQKELF